MYEGQSNIKLPIVVKENKKIKQLYHFFILLIWFPSHFSI